MPTYQYRCNDCDTDLEVVQKFSDAALTECPSCEGQLRKVYSAVGVVFKGSGFYATDNRTKGKANAASSDASSAKTETASESKPAAKAEPAKSSSTASAPTAATPAA